MAREGNGKARRKCAVTTCKVMFAPKNPQQMTCSPEHSKEWRRQYKRQWQNALGTAANTARQRDYWERKRRGDVSVRLLRGMPPGSTDTLVGKLRRVLDEACGDEYSFKDLTVLDVDADPYRQDTAAKHRDGKWAAQQLARAYGTVRQAHLRGLHYAMVIKGNIMKPDGTIYRNTVADWYWLADDAIKAARWLEYIPFDRFVDRRNSAPVIHRRPRVLQHAWVHAELVVEDINISGIEPTPHSSAFFVRQAFQFVIFGEKASLEEVLLPLGDKHHADLYLCTGEISDTLIYRMAKDAAEDGRPLVVFTVADCDPSGHQMSVSIARKLQAFRDLLFPDLQFEIVQAALTVDQVKEMKLPSTPLKDGEMRADRWFEAYGIEQTEVDALLTPEHLEANTLRDLVEAAIFAYTDSTLLERVHKARAKWRKAAQKVVDDSIDQDELDDIRDDAQGITDKIQEINERLRDLIEDIELPPVKVPEPKDPDGDPVDALVSIDDDWVEATEKMIAHKRYEA